MKTALIDDLQCPRAGCGGRLAVSRGAVEPSYRLSGAELTEGLLECSTCLTRFPVISGVAVVVSDVAGWLRANYHYVMAGAASAEGIGSPLRSWLEEGGWHLSNKPADNYYDTPRWINIFTSTHYDERGGGADDFSALGRYIGGEQHVFEVLADVLKANLPGRAQRALDAGTSVGGMAHRCAPLAESVIGIDTAFNSILAARRIHAGQPSPLRQYRRMIEGNCSEARALPTASANAEFVLASALEVPLGKPFGLVTALNLLDVVPDPRRLLRRLHGVLCDGGLLAVASPYSWGSDDVPLGHWLGGRDGQESAQALLAELERLGFDILHESDGVPWVLREHRRWYRVFLNHCVVARKRPQ